MFFFKNEECSSSRVKMLFFKSKNVLLQSEDSSSLKLRMFFFKDFYELDEQTHCPIDSKQRRINGHIIGG